jgi:hypothetical protein
MVFSITASSTGNMLAISIKAYKGFSCPLVALSQPNTSILVTADTTGSNEFSNSFAFDGSLFPIYR